MKDLAIIGGGPAGYTAAERAAAAGLDVVLFERNELGGVCLNEGCIPSKTLLYSAKLYDSALHAEKYGVQVDNPAIDPGKVIDRKNRVVRRLVAGLAAGMKAQGIEVVRGAATIAGQSEEGIDIACDGKSYRADKLLICTGSEPIIPPIEGYGGTGGVVMTSREALQLKERPSSVVVVGGGAIGMEFAGWFNAIGTEVTVIEMLPEVLGGFDAEIAAALREIYTKRGVKFEPGCRVTKIDGNRVDFIRPDASKHEITAEKILICVGRRPVIKGFGIETLGVELDRGGIRVNDRMETSVAHIYAAGDVTGRSMFAHTAYREAEVVVNNLTSGGDYMHYQAVPAVVYTNPEVSMVGLTADAARESGIAFREVTLPMTYSGRFMAENEGVNGICKVIAGVGRGEVLGVHMLGNPSSEILYGVCMAIEREMTVEQLRKVIFPHPTVSEVFRTALFEIGVGDE